MPICQNCHEKWTWKQTMENLFKLYCPYCGRKQFESVSSRKRTSILTICPLIVLSFNLFFELSWWVLGIVVFIIVTITWLMYPFMIKLSNEKEVIW